MRDYSKYEKTPVLFSGAEKKFEIIIDGYRYIVKFQKNSEVGLTFNHVSEYLGSHIFQLLGIPVQETFLGTYEGKNVVVMKPQFPPCRSKLPIKASTMNISQKRSIVSSTFVDFIFSRSIAVISS